MAAAATSTHAPERQLGMLIAALRPATSAPFGGCCAATTAARTADARFYLPGSDADDALQKAGIRFAKAVRGYRPERGASFPSVGTASHGRSPPP